MGSDGIIYALINTETCEAYIGRTFQYETRQREHLQRLKKGNHHSKKLQDSYNVHGPSSFVFCFLDYCTPQNLYQKETVYITLWPHDLFNSLLTVEQRFLRAFHPF
jgi:group I intron endonuclease